MTQPRLGSPDHNSSALAVAVFLFLWFVLVGWAIVRGLA